MTNYTYEQRKMIAEYLEELIGSCKANSTHLSIDYLKEEVKKLKPITFGIIKYNTGAKFKFRDSDNQNQYAIVFNYDAQQHYAINLKSFVLDDLYYINDDVPVEVIDVIKQV